MIYLILDILFYSLTPLNTSFYLFYLTYQKDYLNILSLIIIIYLTHNLLYIPIFIIIYLFKRYHYFNICNKFLQIIITYYVSLNKSAKNGKKVQWKYQFITKMVEISDNNRLIFLTNALKSKLELENN